MSKEVEVTCNACNETRDRCEDNEYCRKVWPTPVVGTPAPLHPFEIRISIGTNTREFILDRLREMVEQFSNGECPQSFGGGYDGNYSITTAIRDVTPAQYRQELEEWCDASRELS